MQVGLDVGVIRVRGAGHENRGCGVAHYMTWLIPGKIRKDMRM
jgi:hypothetical protein